MKEENMSNHTPCEACRHYLGGGCCRINLEPECREGGGYEAWEAAEIDESSKRSKTEILLVRMLLILCFVSYPIARYLQAV